MGAGEGGSSFADVSESLVTLHIAGMMFRFGSNLLLRLLVEFLYMDLQKGLSDLLDLGPKLHEGPGPDYP